jgi:hypothetical protein
MSSNMAGICLTRRAARISLRCSMIDGGVVRAGIARGVVGGDCS